MAKQNVLITNFTAGELSPLLNGRPDVSVYFNGCRIMENFIGLPQGPATMAPGSYFVAEVKDSSKRTRSIPFEFNTEQAYTLELGEGYIRFFKDQGRIEVEGNPVEIATDYTEDELFEINYTQSADTLYLAHRNHPPAKLTRSSHTVWTLLDINFTESPFTEYAVSGAADNGSGLVRLTVTGHGYATGNTVVVRGVEGCTEANGVWPVTYVDDNTIDLQGSAFANAYTGGGYASNEYPGAVAFFEQRLLWGGSYARPQTIDGSKAGDYENMTTGTADDDALQYTLLADQVNRIMWMVPQNYLLVGTARGEWRVGGSSVSDPMTPTSINAKRQTTFGSSSVQGLLVNDVVLFVQQSGRKVREFAYSFEKDGFVAPDLTLRSNHIARDGITSMDYQTEPYSILWATRGDGTLVGMTYERAQESVVCWHRHVTQGEYESVSVIPGDPEDEVWVIVKRTINGQTKRYVEYFKPIEFEEQSDAFFVHCGLSFDGGDPVSIDGATQADPVVISAPGHGIPDGATVLIAGVVGMEDLNGNYYTVANAADDTFELSGIDGTGFDAYVSGGTAQRVARTVSGLDHLEGEEVAIAADGLALANQTVSSGAITLPSYYSVIHVGLPYAGTLKPMRIEGGAQYGTSQGKTKRIAKLTVRFHQTIGGKWGPNEDEDYLQNILYDVNAELFSGDKEAEFDGDYETDGNLVIVQDQPLPMTVLCIVADMTNYG